MFVQRYVSFRLRFMQGSEVLLFQLTATSHAGAVAPLRCRRCRRRTPTGLRVATVCRFRPGPPQDFRGTPSPRSPCFPSTAGAPVPAGSSSGTGTGTGSSHAPVGSRICATTGVENGRAQECASWPTPCRAAGSPGRGRCSAHDRPGHEALDDHLRVPTRPRGTRLVPAAGASTGSSAPRRGEGGGQLAAAARTRGAAAWAVGAQLRRVEPTDMPPPNPDRSTTSSSASRPRRWISSRVMAMDAAPVLP
ncbi:hypothetical protein BCL76_11970 [Streptomyces sp. CG 926]|nr:hypothetical protein BCL76_11970 [Streptomyces sp. CG 926]